MKLSLAIRLGAMLRPQNKYVMFSGSGSCALGAAIEARTGICTINSHNVNIEQAIRDLSREYSLHSRWAICPSCNGKDSVFEIIGTHLNDKHGWTRERIADFVESIEPKDEPAKIAVEQQEPACASSGTR
jgi:hypothetical protein